MFLAAVVLTLAMQKQTYLIGRRIVGHNRAQTQSLFWGCCDDAFEYHLMLGITSIGECSDDDTNCYNRTEQTR